jgi:Short C-terminal domain/Phospholipase_D-nuclease N-terminal
MIAASDYPFLNIFWTMLVFVAWVVWLWILVTVLIDVFGRHDISGWGKAAWALFVIVLPYLGVFIYLIAHGKDMAERRAGMRPGGSMPYSEPHTRNGAADQIATAKQLLDSGAIDQAEFQQLKRKALA